MRTVGDYYDNRTLYVGTCNIYVMMWCTYSMYVVSVDITHVITWYTSILEKKNPENKYERVRSQRERQNRVKTTYPREFTPSKTMIGNGRRCIHESKRLQQQHECSMCVLLWLLTILSTARSCPFREVCRNDVMTVALTRTLF